MAATQTNSKFSDDVQKAALAGMSSVFAGCCMHPVDTCKIRMQIQRPLTDGSKKYKNLL